MSAEDEEDARFAGMEPAIDPQHVRIVEAMLFASPGPVDDEALAARLPDGTDLRAVLGVLAGLYDGRGVNLVRIAGKWAFRTAPDLAAHLAIERGVRRRLSRATVETLSIIAYHQPVTRAEIEEIRGVSLSRGTLDLLLEAGWIRPGRRRNVPGRPVTWVTTAAFLEHFGLAGIEDLPGIEELKAAGLLDPRQVPLLARMEEEALPELPLLEPEVPDEPLDPQDER